MVHGVDVLEKEIINMQESVIYCNLLLYCWTQHLGLTVDLEPREKADQEAFISLIRTKIIPTEVRLSTTAC